MNYKNLGGLLVIVFVLATLLPLHAQTAGQAAGAVPSITKRDPPPGNASKLSILQARSTLIEALKSRFMSKMQTCQRVALVKGCAYVIPSEAMDIRINASGFAFTAPYTAKIAVVSRSDGKVSVNFKKDQEYVQPYVVSRWEPSPLYNVGYLPKPGTKPMFSWVLLWTDRGAAQDFADAFNRLLFAAYQMDPEFVAAAKAWRENPAKPPLGAEADRHRILAENAIKEKNLNSAVEHYEKALEIQPLWPAGWFNLAVIYAEQNKYGDAMDSMQRYLELVPDAPDAKDAREQMIIWEEKAKL